MNPQLEIVVNGRPRRVAAGLSVLDLLHELNLEPGRVAVELNRRIVKQARWGETRLDAGARVEIVQFVGGG